MPGQEDAFIYRRAEEKDAACLAALRMCQLQEEGGPLNEEVGAALKDWYSIHLKDGSFISWLAADSEKIAAASGMTFAVKPPYAANPQGKIGLVSNMYTCPAYRRKGLANELLKRVLEEARAYGRGVVQVTASEMGVLLYRRAGFEMRKNFMQYIF